MIETSSRLAGHSMRLVALVGVFVYSIAQADESKPVILDATPVKVFAFKEGYGLVRSEAALPAEAGTYWVTPLPRAIHGSLWLSWPRESALRDIVSTRAETDREIEATNLPSLLKANEGESVDVYMKEEWQRVTIMRVPPPRDAGAEPRPEDEASIWPPYPPEPTGEMVYLQDNRGLQVVPIWWIEAIRFHNDDPKTRFTVQRKQPVIQFAKEASSEDDGLTMHYLANGVAWSPSYLIDISNGEEALFSANAILVNDLTPLDEAEVELAAGFPHVLFKDEISPFWLDAPIRPMETYKVSQPQAEMLMMGRAMMDMASPPPAPIVGEKSEEQYFFKLGKVSLQKGERGYFPLFTSPVKYEPLYQWTIPSFVDQGGRYRDDWAMNTPPVWHTLKLVNDSDYPWTDGAVMTVKDGRVLGQDAITFTPQGAETSVKITQASFIQAEQREGEVERRPNAIQIQQIVYDLVTIRGEMKATNFGEQTIPLEIVKTVSGEVKQAAGEPDQEKTAAGLNSINPQTKLTWTLELQPGEANALRLEYTYETYVRR